MIDKEIINEVQKSLNIGDYYIDLIPSNSFVKPEYFKLLNLKTIYNQYSEGYNNNRYYPGCSSLNKVEIHYKNNIKSFFKNNYSNIQCLSGTIANIVIFKSLLSSGDKILSMSLESGGHLSHSDINKGNPQIQYVHYGIDSNGIINYSEIEKIINNDPKIKMIIVGYSLGIADIDYKEVSNLAKNHGCYLLADISHISGLIGTGLMNNPIEYSDIVMTTTHKSLRCTKGAIIMSNNLEIINLINKGVFPNLQAGYNSFNSILNAFLSNYWFTDEYKQDMKLTLEYSNIFHKNLTPELSLLGYTKNHQIIIKVGINAKNIESNLESIGILVNSNIIQEDTNWNNRTGLRLGVQNLAFLRYTKSDVRKIALIIKDAIIKTTKNTFEQYKQSLKSEILKIIIKYQIKDYTL